MYGNQGRSNYSSYSSYPHHERRGGSFKKKKKLDFKKIAVALITVLLIVALVAGGISLFSGKTKTIHPSFSIGALDMTEGKYIEATYSIYTKSAFDCTGLTIKVANDANITLMHRKEVYNNGRTGIQT